MEGVTFASSPIAVVTETEEEDVFNYRLDFDTESFVTVDTGPLGIECELTVYGSLTTSGRVDIDDGVAFGDDEISYFYDTAATESSCPVEISAFGIDGETIEIALTDMMGGMSSEVARYIESASEGECTTPLTDDSEPDEDCCESIWDPECLFGSGSVCP